MSFDLLKDPGIEISIVDAFVYRNEYLVSWVLAGFFEVHTDSGEVLVGIPP